MAGSFYFLRREAWLVTACGNSNSPSSAGMNTPTFTPSLVSTPTNTPTPHVVAGTILSPGDVAILGFTVHGTANDQFAFVLLKAVTAGTQINISDQNWAGYQFGTFDGGVIEWIADQNYPAGTIIQALPTTNGSSSSTKAYAVNIYSAGVTYSNVATATVTPGTFAVNPSSPFSLVTVSNTGGGITGLSANGDQLLIYQGSTALAAPASAVTFVGGLTYGALWLTGTPTPTIAATIAVNANTYLPPGLTNGQSAIAISTLNVGNGAYYNCSAGTIGNETQLGALLNNSSNWTIQMTPVDLPIPILVCGITVQ